MLPHVAYNGHSERATSNREAILTALESTHKLKISSTNRKLCQASADSLDAVICLFAADAVASDKLETPANVSDEMEGLIAVRL
jgi:putative ribosome biogenesis GTPase RsgA